jgi:hypothetical protein
LEDWNPLKEPQGLPAFWFWTQDWYMTMVYPEGLNVWPFNRVYRDEGPFWANAAAATVMAVRRRVHIFYLDAENSGPSSGTVGPYARYGATVRPKFDSPALIDLRSTWPKTLANSV